MATITLKDDNGVEHTFDIPDNAKVSNSRLIDGLNAKEQLEHENAALKKMLLEVACYYIAIDDKGRFGNSIYAEPVNKLLGI